MGKPPMVLRNTQCCTSFSFVQFLELFPIKLSIEMSVLCIYEAEVSDKCSYLSFGTVNLNVNQTLRHIM